MAWCGSLLLLYGCLPSRARCDGNSEAAGRADWTMTQEDAETDGNTLGTNMTEAPGQTVWLLVGRQAVELGTCQVCLEVREIHLSRGQRLCPTCYPDHVHLDDESEASCSEQGPENRQTNMTQLQEHDSQEAICQACGDAAAIDLWTGTEGLHQCLHCEAWFCFGCAGLHIPACEECQDDENADDDDDENADK
jgi:hypothetical protein